MIAGKGFACRISGSALIGVNIQRLRFDTGGERIMFGLRRQDRDKGNRQCHGRNDRTPSHQIPEKQFSLSLVHRLSKELIHKVYNLYTTLNYRVPPQLR